MKKIYSSIALAFMLIAAKPVAAQTGLTTAVDFTVTDVDGNVHNLFDILNNGQHVCIDFFFDTCPPCIATSPYFKETYNNFGCNEEDIFFIAIDVGDTDPQVIAYENSVLGGPPGYPSVSGIDGGGNAVITAYGIGAFPTYILIKPDQTIIEQDMWPISNAAGFTSYFASHGLNPIPCTVGLNEQAADLGISVFPNPATDLLSVKSDKTIAGYRVMNMLGEEVLISSGTGAAKNNFNSIDVTSLKSGMYFLEMNVENTLARVVS
ncbi:MAG: T9SS type A sorting domain-containing protein [Bacteroidetes bacterium]|nr:T9SS type A sorting domain-containing protein [Bacteroidota bacterium]